jgi:hypothetical protein
MRHLSSLKLARAVPDPDNDPGVFIVYRIFGCSQSKDVNLKDLPSPVMQRFAVINPQRVDDEVFEILEAARDIGALAPVKLMDVSGDSLYLHLDAKVDSTIFTAIESLWMALMGRTPIVILPCISLVKAKSTPVAPITPTGVEPRKFLRRRSLG